MKLKAGSKLNLYWKLQLAVLGVFLLTASTAFAASVIKIGVSGPMKFPAGEDMYIGAQMAADEINAKGGISIKGTVHKVEIVKTDSNEYLSVPDAVNSLERLVNVDKVNFVIGGARSESILAQMEVMAENKIVYIMAGGGSPKLTEQVGKNYDKYKYFFRTTTPHAVYQVQGVSAVIDLVAKKIRKELGIQKPKVAIVGEKAIWVDAIVNYAKAVFPKMGMEIAGVWRPSATANDLSAELSAIKSAGAHIIFTIYTGPVGIIFSKQWGGLEIPAIPVGINIEAQSYRHWKTTEGKCEYEITLNAVARANISPRTISAFDKFVKIKGDSPVYTGMGGYDGVYLLMLAAEKAQSLASDKVVAELEKTDYQGVAGRIVFNPPGDKLPHDLKYGPGYLTFFGQQWQKGKLVLVWPDGSELHPVIGAGSGWDKVKYPDTVEIKLPPVMIKHWGKAK